MIVNHVHKFVFVAVQRAASMSLHQSLMAISGSAKPRGGRHRTIPPDSAADYFTFAITRNPYAREWSHYCYRRAPKRGGPSRRLRKLTRQLRFPQYVRQHTAHPSKWQDVSQARFLREVSPDLVLRFEELPGCLAQLPFWPPGHILPHRNAASRGPWQDAYTSKIAGMVYKWAKEDFEQFGYNEASWQSPPNRATPTILQG